MVESGVVYLGCQDDPINEEYNNQLDYSVNKIGGEPDFPYSIAGIQEILACNLCNQPCRLIVQLYSPLETCKHHRTLYVFACISSSCWNKRESWKCLRIQMESKQFVTQSESKVGINTMDWCEDANDWGEIDDVNSILENLTDKGDKISADKESNNSFKDVVGMYYLSIDEKTVNYGVQGGGVAGLHPPIATAEIEAYEGQEIVTIDSPIRPKINLGNILYGEEPSGNVPPTASFIAYFMSIYPEPSASSYSKHTNMDNHVAKLLNEYKTKYADFSENIVFKQKCDEFDQEEYEKSQPLHGDKLFHQYLTRIKENPEQILRYHHGSPLLLHSLQEHPGLCKYCSSELVFEFQLISTIIPKLRLSSDKGFRARLDFGTVLIYTCKNTCWSPGDLIKDEVVMLQTETLLD